MPGNGPIPSRIMIVGEAWGAEEERTGQPFMGASGQELNRMLHEAGIMRSEVYVTNLINARPPNNDITAWVPTKKKDITPRHVPLRDKMVMPCIVEGYKSLCAEIDAVRPNVIVALGTTALWALTGRWGVLRWRGSLLRQEDRETQFWAAAAVPPGFPPREPAPKVIPSIHPAAILREWSFRPAALNDLRRVKAHCDSREYSPPAHHFIIRPSFTQVMEVLNELLTRLQHEEVWVDFDLETAQGHITCAGISWSRLEALCIPITCTTNREGYWSCEEEAVIIWLLRSVLTHPKVKVRGQNLLYDAQYTHRHWCFVPRVAQDTMISHHSTFSGMRKSLDFQASLYVSHYVQWKPEKGVWKDGG